MGSERRSRPHWGARQLRDSCLPRLRRRSPDRRRSRGRSVADPPKRHPSHASVDALTGRSRRWLGAVQAAGLRTACRCSPCSDEWSSRPADSPVPRVTNVSPWPGARTGVVRLSRSKRPSRYSSPGDLTDRAFLGRGPTPRSGPAPARVEVPHAPSSRARRDPRARPGPCRRPRHQVGRRLTTVSSRSPILVSRASRPRPPGPT